MPAHTFEYLYAYFYLRGKLGATPPNVAVCKLLEIDACTGLQRREAAARYGYIVKPPLGKYKAPLELTDRGAETMAAVLDGNETVYVFDGAQCCLNRDIFPDNIKYSGMNFGQYQVYAKALAEYGSDTRPTT